MADRVEMAVCEDCGRVFQPASMRGRLCMACAAKHTAAKKDDTPLGFKKVTCQCCGNAFAAPRASTAEYCWKCADRRQRAAERRHKMKQPAELPPGMEWHVCRGCGEMFPRPAKRLGRPRVYCAECAKERNRASDRRAMRKYIDRLRKENRDE